MLMAEPITQLLDVVLEPREHIDGTHMRLHGDTTTDQDVLTERHSALNLRKWRRGLAWKRSSYTARVCNANGAVAPSLTRPWFD